MATKKSAAKKSAATKAAEKTSAIKTTARKVAATKAAKKAPAKKAAAKSAAGGDNYTKPELRDKIKAEVMAGDKGGRAGQWSARKAQMVAHEYETQGGGYKHERTETQESLKTWGDEHWHTADGKPAIQGEQTHRYLPDAAWKDLSSDEKKATDKKKMAGAKKGKQFVPNTSAAKTARKKTTDHKD